MCVSRHTHMQDSHSAACPCESCMLIWHDMDMEDYRCRGLVGEAQLHLNFGQQTPWRMYIRRSLSLRWCPSSPRSRFPCLWLVASVTKVPLSLLLLQHLTLFYSRPPPAPHQLQTQSHFCTPAPLLPALFSNYSL
jgi:hypothetical protein